MMDDAGSHHRKMHVRDSVASFSKQTFIFFSSEYQQSAATRAECDRVTSNIAMVKI